MAALWLLAALVIGPLAADTPGSTAPVYTADSIANSAANVSGLYAPNTFVSIYGDNLSFNTRAIAVSDFLGTNIPPTVLANTGVRVLLGLVPADIYYVSPRQINILIPPTIRPGPMTLTVVRDGFSGPSIPIIVTTAAPAFFQVDDHTVIATHADSTLVTAEAPAHRGEIVVLYGTGLGPINPPLQNILPSGAAQVAAIDSFRILLNGTPVDRSRILYAGVTPGFLGLYQVNLRLPDDAPANPEIRVGLPDPASVPGRILPIE